MFTSFMRFSKILDEFGTICFKHGCCQMTMAGILMAVSPHWLGGFRKETDFGGRHETNNLLFQKKFNCETPNDLCSQ